MHSIEPYYRWRNLYAAEDDEKSPFFGREYSEFEFSNAVYNYLIHPQWDEFGSTTLYMKILYADYRLGFAIIEFIGEWNDCLYNDIMFLKRDVIDIMLKNNIRKFILIGEHVFNFHYSDDSYYQEWHEDIEDGWIVGLNFRQHVVNEFKNCFIHYYIQFFPSEYEIFWRKYNPTALFETIEKMMHKRLKSI